MDHTTTTPPSAYDRVMRAIHWATLALVSATYGLIWLAHSGLIAEAYQPVLQLHRSFGLTIAALTIFRLAWRWRAQIPPLPGDLAGSQKLAARITEGLIYVLLLLQPLLGVLHTGFRGQQVNLYLLGTLPPVVVPDRALARLTHNLHELGGNALLIVIGLHAAAALWHHFIRRDGVLLSMLPAGWQLRQSSRARTDARGLAS
ncbi:MAG: cytochrome b [Alphaproteobacteria bacterium]|nr:cytochrome b [Alphaproteobacteria bacterium]